jgi:hypothetical protein
LNSAVKRLTSTSDEYICFSPAFVFDNLARGPPASARV